MDCLNKFPHFDFSDTHVQHLVGQEQVTWRHLPLVVQEQVTVTVDQVTCVYISKWHNMFFVMAGGVQGNQWQLYLASIWYVRDALPTGYLYSFHWNAIYNCTLGGDQQQAHRDGSSWACYSSLTVRLYFCLFLAGFRRSFCFSTRSFHFSTRLLMLILHDELWHNVE